MTGKSRIGTILLLITALIWGTGFSIGNIGMRYIPIYTYNGIKSIVAGLFLLVVILIGKRRGEHTNPNSRRTMQGGIACGVALFVASSLQNYGIAYGSVGKTSFITTLYIVFVPIISFILFKKKIQKRVGISVLLAVIGMYLLGWKSDSAFEYIDGSNCNRLLLSLSKNLSCL